MFVYVCLVSLLVWTEPVHLILKEHLPNFIWIDCMITFCNFLSFPRLPVTCPEHAITEVQHVSHCFTSKVPMELRRSRKKQTRSVWFFVVFLFSLVVFSHKKHYHHKLELTDPHSLLLKVMEPMAWPWLNGPHFANAQRSRPGFARGICLGSCLEDEENAWKFWRDSYIIVDYLHHITSPIFFHTGMRQIWLWHMSLCESYHEYYWLISDSFKNHTGS